MTFLSIRSFIAVVLSVLIIVQPGMASFDIGILGAGNRIADQYAEEEALRLLPVAITAQPVNVTVPPESPVKFKVVYRGADPITIQWYKDGVAIPGATTATLNLSSVSLGDDGKVYYVVLTNDYGQVESRHALLSVTPAAAPVITKVPVSLSVTAGQQAAFSVTATGTGLTYQWVKNGANIIGATSASYNIPSTTVDDSGTYWVIVTSVGGASTTSNTATLTVTPGAAPVITAGPTNKTVTAGQTATFSVTATGTGLTYQWQKNGSNIPGATSSAYTTPATVLADNGATFLVVVTASGGASTTSNSATLTVNSAGVTITQQPANQTVTAGQTATFSVTATGAGLTYQWQKNGTNISSGATGATYTTPATVLADNGATFLVVVTASGGASATSNSATLTVNAAGVTITQQPANQTVTAGQTATFSVTATGTGLTYQWQKNGSNIQGATSSAYTTPATVLADNASTFRAVVTASGGASATSNSATLTVNGLAGPTINQQPKDAMGGLGQSVDFTVSATGVGAIAYQWYKNGIPITGSNSNHLTYIVVAGDNGATFYVVCTNDNGSGGSTTSRVATLTLQFDSQPPSVPNNPSATLISVFGITYIEVAWVPSTDNSQSEVYYDLEIAKNPAFSVDSLINLGIQASTQSNRLDFLPSDFPSVTSGTTLYFHVRARDSAGNKSNFSTTVPFSAP